MNLLDLAVGAVIASSAVGGYRLGLVAGGTSGVLLLQALALATLAVPPVVTFVGGSSPNMRLVVGAAFFVAAGFAGQYAGRWMGERFRAQLPLGAYLRFDKAAGAAAGPVAVLAATWLLVLPAFAETSGAPSRLVRQSAVARLVDGVFPDAPDASLALGRLAGPAASPQVFGGLLPSLDTGPPPEETGLPAGVVDRVAASAVRVEGTACGSERDGSGFAVGPDLVVTSAHVVAGQDDTVVVRDDGARLAATVVTFDHGRDLALLAVPGLERLPLAIGEGQVGTTAAVFGHPFGQDALEVSPASIRQRVTALGRGLYGTLVRRDVYVMSARLDPGDSGASVVDEDGEVVGVAFAIASDRSSTAYALTADELRPLLSGGAIAPVATGPCLG